MKVAVCFAMLLFTSVAAVAAPPAAAHSVSLAWTASADSVTGYNVYRSTTSGSYAGAPLNGGTPVGGVNYTDAAVTPGTYFYVVRAVIVAGTTQTESADSNEAKAVILPSPPTALQTTSAN